MNAQCFLNISYVDEESKEEITQKLALDPKSMFDELYKIYVKDEIEKDIQNQSINEGLKKKII